MSSNAALYSTYDVGPPRNGGVTRSSGSSGSTIDAIARGFVRTSSGAQSGSRKSSKRQISSSSWIDSFRERVRNSKLDLLALLRDLKQDGARIYGIGAPSRASTLVNFTGLDDGIVDCVLEISTSKKLDRYLPGTAIPVVDERKLFDDQPEYALLLSWHIADELCDNLLRKGFQGDFVVPLPEPRLVTSGGHGR